MPHWLYLSIAIVAEVVGTTFLKSAEGFTRIGPSLVVAVSYAVAFFFLGLALKTLPVGIAYAIWAGVGVALIALAGYAFFGQALDPPAIVGMALIVIGVAVINLFSKTTGNA
ncbi:MAG TPA: multidrug efflux SMR transporter [Wenzhouxiangella sp.]|nr:multidrug efflux SMR transporter [Wenzhouxiangella sp.]